MAKPGEGSYVGFFIDSDGDGDLDLFVSAMNFYEDIVQSQVTGLALRPTRAYLYRNDGDHFPRHRPPAGVGPAPLARWVRAMATWTTTA